MHRLLETAALRQTLQLTVPSPAVRCKYPVINVETRGVDEKQAEHESRPRILQHTIESKEKGNA